MGSNKQGRDEHEVCHINTISWVKQRTLNRSLVPQRLRRFHARRAPARIQRGQEREHHRHAADAQHVVPAQVGRQHADEIDFLGQELDAQQVLDERHDHIHVERQQRAQPGADGRADHADQRPLDHEDLHDGRGRGAQRAQNRNIGLLVGHRHHQRGHQVERGHGHDHGQDHEHHALLALHGREPGGIGHGPVAHEQLARHGRLEFVRHARRLLHVGHAQAQAGGGVDFQQFFGIVEVDEGQRGIIEIVTGLENADHVKRVQARHHAGAAGLAVGQRQRDFFAGLHIEQARQLGAQHDVVAARLQGVEAALAHLLHHVRHLRLQRGLHAADDGGLEHVAAHQHALDFGKRGGAGYFRILAGCQRLLAPVGHLATHVEQFDVGQHRQHAIGDFLLEAVHDRQHDDQGGHAERDAGHGNQGDKGDETVTAAALAGPRRSVPQLYDFAITRGPDLAGEFLVVYQFFVAAAAAHHANQAQAGSQHGPGFRFRHGQHGRRGQHRLRDVVVAVHAREGRVRVQVFQLVAADGVEHGLRFFDLAVVVAGEILLAAHLEQVAVIVVQLPQGQLERQLLAVAAETVGVRSFEQRLDAVVDAGVVVGRVGGALDRFDGRGDAVGEELLAEVAVAGHLVHAASLHHGFTRHRVAEQLGAGIDHEAAADGVLVIRVGRMADAGERQGDGDDGGLDGVLQSDFHCYALCDAGRGGVAGGHVEVHVRHRCAGAAGHGHGAAFHVQVVVGVEEGQVGEGQFQAHHAGLAQRHQFASVGLAVAVGVLPDQQAGEIGVVGVDKTVAIAVVAGQLGKTVALGRTAEQFADVVDLAVVVAVDGQEAVALGQPAGLDCLARAQQVEAAGHVFTGDGMDAVAVEVDGDRGDGRIPAHVVLAGREHDGVGLGDVGQRLGVAGHVGVDGVVGAGVLDAPLPVAHVVALKLDVGLVEHQVVAARSQVGKLVVAVGVGLDRGAQLLPGGRVVQRHGHAANALFAGVLHPVVVAVAPDLVADAGLAVDAGVLGGDVLAGAQRDGAGAAHVVAHAGDVRIGGVGAGAAFGEVPAAAVGHFHLVIARAQPVKQVLAAVMGDGGGLEHVVGVVQLDGDAVHAFFARILHAVGVAVFPHQIADARCLDQAGIAGLVDRARSERELRDQAGSVRVGVQAVVIALVLLGEQVVVRRVDLDRVLARADVGEQVLAAGVGDVGGNHHALVVEQLDGDAARAAFVALLDAVAIGVVPDAVADGTGLHQAGVHVGDVLAGRHSDLAQVAAGIGIAVDGVVAAHVLRGGHVAARQFHGHAVSAGLHRKLVVAVAVGGGGLDHLAGAVDQLHGHAGLAGFAAVLDAVAVLVEPHAVADGGGGQQAGVHRLVHFAGGHGKAVRQAGGAGVGVDGVVARVASMGRGEGHAFRQRRLVELDAVGARFQVGKLVVAAGIGIDRRAHGLAVGVQQRDLDVAHARFAAVLQAVAVLVQPYAVAHGGGLVQAGVDGVVDFAGSHRDLAALAGSIDVAVERGVAARVGGGDDITFRRGDSHRVGAGVGREAVLAVRAGGGGLHDVAGSVLQLHGGAGHARFTRILHAVGIGVFPHAVADGGFLRHQAGAHGHVVARGDGDLGGHAGRGVGVGAAAAGRAGAGGRELMAGRQRGLVELHAVRTGLQVGELVVAAGVGGGNRAWHGLAGSVKQGDAHAGRAGFAGADLAVAVGVVPHVFAQRCRTVQAGVDVEVVLARRQHHGRGAAGVHVAVERGVAALAGTGEHIAGRRRHGHRVGAGIDREAVLAAVVGGDAGNHVAAGVLEVDDHAVDAGFARILHAVAVLVFPHTVAQRALLDHDARIHVLHAVARGQHDLRGGAGGVGIRVERGVRALVAGREQVVVRQRGLVELHAVRAWLQTGELVMPVGVGGGCAHRLAGSVEQRDLDAGHARFARVLHAVAVGVVPDRVAQAGWTVQAGVDGAVGRARGQLDQAAVAGGIDIAVHGSVRALRWRCDGVAGRGLDGHRVRAGIHVEVVVAAGVGHGGCNDGAVGPFQLHFHAGHAGFTGVLHAVAVGVFPDQVADMGRRHLEGEVVRGDAGVGRAATDQAARVADREADIELARRVLARFKAQLAGLDVGGRDFSVDGDGRAIEHQLAGSGQRGNDDRLEGIVLDRVHETEVGLAQGHRCAIGKVEGLVGAGRRVVDGIDNHAQRQRDRIALGALVEHELEGAEFAVVIGRPLAGTHVDGVRIDLAEQRRIRVGGRAVRQSHLQGIDLQRVAGNGCVARAGQDSGHVKVTFGIFANVNTGGKFDRAHAYSFLQFVFLTFSVRQLLENWRSRKTAINRSPIPAMPYNRGMTEFTFALPFALPPAEMAPHLSRPQPRAAARGVAGARAGTDYRRRRWHRPAGRGLHARLRTAGSRHSRCQPRPLVHPATGAYPGFEHPPVAGRPARAAPGRRRGPRPVRRGPPVLRRTGQDLVIWRPGPVVPACRRLGAAVHRLARLGHQSEPGRLAAGRRLRARLPPPAERDPDVVAPAPGQRRARGAWPAGRQLVLVLGRRRGGRASQRHDRHDRHRGRLCRLGRPHLDGGAGHAGAAPDQHRPAAGPAGRHHRHGGRADPCRPGQRMGRVDRHGAADRPPVVRAAAGSAHGRTHRARQPGAEPPRRHAGSGQHAPGAAQILAQDQSEPVELTLKHADMTRIAIRPCPFRESEVLRQEGIHPVLARLYAARGLTDPKDLSSELASMIPPSGLMNIGAAAVFLADSIAANKRMVIVADYDCDGATACAVALRGLRQMGANIDYIVPNRFEYGYGLTPEIVALTAREKQPDIIVTVDNARMRLPQQAHCGRGRGVLRAAGAARGIAPARRVRRPDPAPTAGTAGFGGAGHGGRRGAARPQQPHPGGAGPETHARRQYARGRGRPVPGGRTQPAHGVAVRPRFCAGAAPERGRPAGRHVARHRMPAHRRRGPRLGAGPATERHQPQAPRDRGRHAGHGAAAPRHLRAGPQQHHLRVRRQLAPGRDRHRRLAPEGKILPPDHHVRTGRRRLDQGLRALDSRFPPARRTGPAGTRDRNRRPAGRRVLHHRLHRPDGRPGVGPGLRAARVLRRVPRGEPARAQGAPPETAAGEERRALRRHLVRSRGRPVRAGAGSVPARRQRVQRRDQGATAGGARGSGPLRTGRPGRPQHQGRARAPVAIGPERLFQTGCRLEGARRGCAPAAGRPVQQRLVRLEEKPGPHAGSGLHHAHFLPAGHLQGAAHHLRRPAGRRMDRAPTGRRPPRRAVSAGQPDSAAHRAAPVRYLPPVAVPFCGSGRLGTGAAGGKRRPPARPPLQRWPARRVVLRVRRRHGAGRSELPQGGGICRDRPIRRQRAIPVHAGRLQRHLPRPARPGAPRVLPGGRQLPRVASAGRTAARRRFAGRDLPERAARRRHQPGLLPPCAGGQCPQRRGQRRVGGRLARPGRCGRAHLARRQGQYRAMDGGRPAGQGQRPAGPGLAGTRRPAVGVRGQSVHPGTAGKSRTSPAALGFKAAGVERQRAAAGRRDGFAVAAGRGLRARPWHIGAAAFDGQLRGRARGPAAELRQAARHVHVLAHDRVGVGHAEGDRHRRAGTAPCSAARPAQLLIHVQRHRRHDRAAVAGDADADLAVRADRHAVAGARRGRGIEHAVRDVAVGAGRQLGLQGGVPRGAVVVDGDKAAGAASERDLVAGAADEIVDALTRRGGTERDHVGDVAPAVDEIPALVDERIAAGVERAGGWRRLVVAAEAEARVQLGVAVRPGQHEDIGQVVALGALGVVDAAGHVIAGHQRAAVAFRIPVIHEHGGLVAGNETPGAAPVAGRAHDRADLRQAGAVLVAEHGLERIRVLEFVQRAGREVRGSHHVAVGDDLLRHPQFFARGRRLRHAAHDGLDVGGLHVLGGVEAQAVHAQRHQLVQVGLDLALHVTAFGFQVGQTAQPAHHHVVAVTWRAVVAAGDVARGMEIAGAEKRVRERGRIPRRAIGGRAGAGRHVVDHHVHVDAHLGRVAGVDHGLELGLGPHIALERALRPEPAGALLGDIVPFPAEHLHRRIGGIERGMRRGGRCSADQAGGAQDAGDMASSRMGHGLSL
uniref:DDH domain-containing protein n=1 Tax=Tanacetum cinerariifolium TaxID=118510 RepID=A0A699GE35_TANCI|nr:hypothetical protein [Tanacetum cinerariifolium]